MPIPGTDRTEMGTTVTDLCNADVSLFVVDNAGCRSEQTLNVLLPTPLTSALQSTTNDVNSQNIGAISVTLTGGSAPFTYQWTKDGLPFATTKDLNNIGVGTYSLVATDNNGCVTQLSNIVITNTVGTLEPNWAKGMKMVPNPSTGLVQLQYTSALGNELEVGIVDATGRVLMTLVSNTNGRPPFTCLLNST